MLYALTRLDTNDYYNINNTKTIIKTILKYNIFYRKNVCSSCMLKIWFHFKMYNLKKKKTNHNENLNN